MNRLVIAIDCDDVLVETAQDLLQFYNQKYGTSLDQTNFYATDIDPSRFGVGTFHEVIERFSERFLDTEHLEIAPSQSTIEAIHRLAGAHELHLITGRSSTMEQATLAMIDRYFKDCFTSVEHTNYITADKHAVKRTKGEVCRQIGADVLIDDYIEHVRNVIAAGVPHAIIFGDFDWGKRGSVPDNTKRCVSWREVEAEIERIAHS